MVTLAGLTLPALAFAMAVALVAAFVRGLAGFGMAILLVPLLGLVVLPTDAVVVSNMLGLMIGLVGVRRIWGEGESSSIVPIALLAMLATPLGLVLLAATPPEIARLVIAAVGIGAFVIVLLPMRHDHVPSRVETGATGLAAGVLTGFAGMPGPPVVPYYVRRPIPAALARASMLSVFLATSLASTVAALFLHLAHARHALLAGLLLGPVILGNAIGGHAFGRISDRAWRILVGLLLGATALAALVRLLD